MFVGLGNPGDRYHGTRHNLGAELVELFAARQHISLKKSDTLFLFGEGRIEGHAVALAIPRTFMNESGLAISALRSTCNFNPGELLIIHDDMDLPVGQLRFKKGGRDGGHKGVRSVIGAVGTDRFWRLKLGIGRPSTLMDDIRYVLDKVSDQERSCLTQMVELAVEALLCFVVQGSDMAMNRYNQRPAE